MEPENADKQPEEQLHASHTYQDDLAQAMNATDAPVVQELLAHAREQQAEEEVAVVEEKERKWYGVTSLLLIILTLGVIGYGTWYYLHLTVPTQPAMSVGVFPYTENIIANNTSIERVVANLLATTTLPEGKPVLVNLTEPQNNILLSNTELYSFFGATVPEPLQTAISVARLGAINTGKEVVPFIILSVPNPEKASQELTNAELSLLKYFYKPLNIDLSLSAGKPQAFASQYFYNLPVRTLTTTDDSTHLQSLVFLYGYASNNIVVITTKPEVLKAVCDAIVNQR